MQCQCPYIFINKDIYTRISERYSIIYISTLQGVKHMSLSGSVQLYSKTLANRISRATLSSLHSKVSHFV